MGQDVVGMGMMIFLGYNFIGEDDIDVFIGLMIDIVGGVGMFFVFNFVLFVDNGGMILIYVLICLSLVIDVGVLDNNMFD